MMARLRLLRFLWETYWRRVCQNNRLPLLITLVQEMARFQYGEKFINYSIVTCWSAEYVVCAMLYLV